MLVVGERERDFVLEREIFFGTERIPDVSERFG